MTSLRWALCRLGMVAGFLVGCSDLTSAPSVRIQKAPLIGGLPDTATRGVVGMVVDQMSGCTGSLIAPNLVLTARHCVASINSSNGTVVCGQTNFGPAFSPSAFVVTPDDNLRDGVPAGSQYAVERVVTTPGSGVCGNDVSLLILSQNVGSTTAPLLVPRVDDPPTANEAFDAVGYGITDPDDIQGTTFGQRLRVNDLDVMCVGSTCSQLGGTRTEWGAMTPVCSGDSGGPALDSAGRVMGVASRGDSNCQSALYGMVSAWKSLIVDTAIDAATSGGYTPPSWTGGATTDGGTPDSGTPDSGTPDSGTPDSGAPDSGTPEPDSGTVEPDSGTPPADAGPGTVGEPCDGSCSGGLACYELNADERGICVPTCSTADRSCPRNYTCSVRIGVCAPDVPDVPNGDDDGNSSDDPDNGGDCACRAAPGPDRPGAWLLAFLMLASFAVRRRRSVMCR